MPPHPILGMHKEVKRAEKDRLLKHDKVVVMSLANGTRIRRESDFRRFVSDGYRDDAILRVWESKERTMDVAVAKLGMWVIKQWALNGTVESIKRWYLAMRSEQGAVACLYLMLRLQRDHIRTNLLFPWRVVAQKELREAANDYKFKRMRARKAGPSAAKKMGHSLNSAKPAPKKFEWGFDIEAELGWT